jgi:hypothetical protein
MDREQLAPGRCVYKAHVYTPHLYFREVLAKTIGEGPPPPMYHLISDRCLDPGEIEDHFMQLYKGFRKVHDCSMGCLYYDVIDVLISRNSVGKRGRFWDWIAACRRDSLC